MTKTTYIIAGDIGGTNSRFALHLTGQSEPLLVHVYSNEEALKTMSSDEYYHHATLKPFLEKCLADVDQWKSMGGEDALLSQVQVVACLAGPLFHGGVIKTGVKGAGHMHHGLQKSVCIRTHHFDGKAARVDDQRLFGRNLGWQVHGALLKQSVGPWRFGTRRTSGGTPGLANRDKHRGPLESRQAG